MHCSNLCGARDAGFLSGSRGSFYGQIKRFPNYKSSYLDQIYAGIPETGERKRENERKRERRKFHFSVSVVLYSSGSHAWNRKYYGSGDSAGVRRAGAIFWMWISAFLGMMTAYAENYLGIKYRYRDKEGKWIGGAMVYMERGLGCRPLACIFAVCCLGASLGMGNMVQGNSMAKGLEEAFHIPPFFSGSLCMILVAAVLAGGTKRIARITEKLVPVMAAAYLGGAFLVLGFHQDQIGEAFGLIFREAFGIRAAAGGAAGYGVSQAVRMGIARGIFSNEAGLGSSVMAHAQSDVKQPEVQGMWAILEIFIDTMVVCTVTALVILVSGVYQPEIFAGYIQAGAEMVDGTTLTGIAFETVIPGGRQFLAAASVLFAFATIIGWSYFGQQTAAYLGKEKGAAIYRLVYILLVLPGCMMAPSVIWELSDALNGLMAIPNLTALFSFEPGSEIQVEGVLVQQKSFC